MPKPSAACAWSGAPPACGDGFAFVNGDFFAEVSGQNRHRRATQAELKEHFASGSDKDHPAHWFEAQLVHYGLKPSKTKAVARMRLFDAVNASKLAVPAHITKLEGSLKKEWTAKDREAKKALKTAGGAGVVAGAKRTTSTTAKATSVKRKADTDAKATASTTVAASDSSKQPVVKKARTAAPKKESVEPQANQKAKSITQKTAVEAKASGAKTVAKQANSPSLKKTPGPRTASEETKATVSAARTKQTARRGNAVSQGSTRSISTAIASPVRAPRTKQTARRGTAFAARGRIPAPTAQAIHYHGSSAFNDHEGFAYDDPPPPYSEEDEADDSDGEETTSATLGLLNGRYDISSRTVTGEWPFLGSEFELVLTLAGSSLWGRFDLGIIEGVLYFDERPMSSSHDLISFKWRGRENEGPILYGDNNDGWMKFLGDGRVKGWFNHLSIEFRGQRLAGQGTRSEIEARQMQDDWNGYSEAEYERQRRARW